MNEELLMRLDLVKSVLKEVEIYSHACRVLTFDKETICPPDAMEEQGEVSAFLDNQAFRLMKRDDFIEAADYLYEHCDELGEFDRRMAVMLRRDRLKTKNITPDMEHEFSKIMNRAFVNWINAKQDADFALFAPSLKEVRDTNLRQAELREADPELAAGTPLDALISDYEYGMTCADLDECFGRCKERLIPLLRRILSSGRKIRTDFMSRRVTDEQQKELAQCLLETIGYDFRRGAFTTTEHPFTDGLGRNDVRVTTHYHPDDFSSSMYSIIHEGGHALFDQLQPQENYDHFITGMKTMGMHESVSRFYENRIGRSREFVQLIYPKIREIMPHVVEDVTEEELYEALNVVQPSLIRTQADEFTYTIHVIIRYEIEKMIINEHVPIADLPRIWNDKYEEYLGVRPSNDREGILQDVHWSSGFGYFPTYAVGNMYNAMYMNRMKEDLNVADIVRNGDFAALNGWMKEHVFEKADRLSPKEWIYDITGRSFTPEDFLDYLEQKYSELYGIVPGQS